MQLKRNSWHARLMKATWDKDPKSYRSFCAYFWLTGLNMLLSPFLFIWMIIKAFLNLFSVNEEDSGKYAKFVRKSRSYRKSINTDKVTYRFKAICWFAFGCILAVFAFSLINILIDVYNYLYSIFDVNYLIDNVVYIIIAVLAGVGLIWLLSKLVPLFFTGLYNVLDFIVDKLLNVFNFLTEKFCPIIDWGTEVSKEIVIVEEKADNSPKEDENPVTINENLNDEAEKQAIKDMYDSDDNFEVITPIEEPPRFFSEEEEDEDWKDVIASDENGVVSSDNIDFGEKGEHPEEDDEDEDPEKDWK